MKRWRPAKHKGHMETRRQVFERDDFSCLHCGATPPDRPACYDGAQAVSLMKLGDKFISLEVDHIIPRLYGGTHEISNLQTLCNRCNASKGATL